MGRFWKEIKKWGSLLGFLSNIKSKAINGKKKKKKGIWKEINLI
jgi:hypothetical protein